MDKGGNHINGLKDKELDDHVQGFTSERWQMSQEKEEEDSLNTSESSSSFSCDICHLSDVKPCTWSSSSLSFKKCVNASIQWL